VTFAFGSQLWLPLLALAAFAPATLGLYFLRLDCYLSGRPLSAVRLSLIYSTTLLAGAFMLRRTGTAGAGSIVLLMGTAALVAVLSAGPARLLQTAVAGTLRTEMQPVLRQHWRFGRWLAASSVSYWLGAAAYLPLSAAIIGLDAAGAMRAIQALFQPLEQVIGSLGMLLVPAVARRRASGGVSVVRSLSYRIAGIYVAVAVSYAALLVPISDWALDQLYAGRYGDYQWMVPVLAMGSILASAASALVIGLNSVERTDAVFLGRAAGAVASLVIGIPLLVFWQLPGAVSAVVMSTCVVFSVVAYLHRRILGTPSTG
jgi:O-antigen/teichoic acid export membrane protein